MSGEIRQRKMLPKYIEVRGAKVHNLKNINVDVPLNEIVAIAGVSGSGKSSLALGALYAEGSRRYLESLSTYTRRRMTQAERADVDDVRYVPAALALRQRPGVPGIRSTFGTLSELLNSLRLMFSRLASHRCPNGHYCPPSLSVAAMQEITCPVCGAKFYGPGAEELAFNSTGACKTCGGTGVVQTVNEAALVPDDSKTIDEGAVVVWGTLMWSLMKDIVRTMGVRTDVPFRDLTPEEKEIVYHGELKKHHIHYVNPNTLEPAEMDFNYYSAVNSVKNSLAKVKDEKGMKRIEKYLEEDVCPDCHGTRLSEAARAPRLRGIGLDEATAMTLSELHPYNLKGLTGVMDDLRADGNSVIIVDHDTQVLKHADWMIEMGKGAGADGGTVISEGKIEDISKNSRSVIGPFLSDKYEARIRPVLQTDSMFEKGVIHLETEVIHTVHPLDVRIPMGRLTVVTGVSGSGKTTMVLESLIPALKAKISGQRLPSHVKNIEAAGITQVKLIDATPIGINVRSTVATYANVHDALRKVYAKTEDAKEGSFKAGDFSYNTGKLRCPTCDGTGEISLDVQFLPDVKIPCPDCRGSRYRRDAFDIRRKAKDGNEYSLPELMNMSVDQVLHALGGLKFVQQRLQVLHDLGLGYLTLGEETPGLSGGEAQRLKLASEMGKGQSDSVFVFDEPTIGLHPQDVRTLLHVFQTLIDHGATVVVIEHDLDVIKNADYIIDMGPGGGKEGGRIVASGTSDEIKQIDESITGHYI